MVGQDYIENIRRHTCTNIYDMCVCKHVYMCLKLCSFYLCFALSFPFYKVTTLVAFLLRISLQSVVWMYVHEYRHMCVCTYLFTFSNIHTNTHSLTHWKLAWWLTNNERLTFAMDFPCQCVGVVVCVFHYYYVSMNNDCLSF